MTKSEFWAVSSIFCGAVVAATLILYIGAERERREKDELEGTKMTHTMKSCVNEGQEIEFFIKTVKLLVSIFGPLSPEIILHAHLIFKLKIHT